MGRRRAAPGLFTGLGGVQDKGFAVHTLGNGRILFVRADHNAFKSAEIAGAGVVCTLGYGAGDRMIGLLFFHVHFKNHPWIIRFRKSSGIPDIVLSGQTEVIRDLTEIPPDVIMKKDFQNF